MVTWRNLCALVVFFSLGAFVQAETITFDAVGRGWYRNSGADSGYYNPASNNYMAGRYTGSFTAEYRNFFVFDLGSVAGSISGATLRVSALNIGGGGHTYSLFDVETSVLALTAGGSNNGLIFTDLGTGSLYGTRDIQASEQNTYLEIPLTAAFVSAANTASGWFALGGALSLPEGTSDQYVFGYGGEKALSYSQLVVTTVPEPGTVAMLLTGASSVLALAYVRRRR